MGQRSQFYISIENPDTKKKSLVARYYQWNYGNRMVSRARHTLEWLKGRVEDELGMGEYYATCLSNPENSEAKKLIRIMETNFDMEDVVLTSNIISEYDKEFLYEDFKDVFDGQDNNDGQFFVDITFDKNKKAVVKYAFISHMGYETPETPTEYMKNYSVDEEDDYTADNIAYIEQCSLMTADELIAFKDYDYVSDMGLYNPKDCEVSFEKILDEYNCKYKISEKKADIQFETAFSGLNVTVRFLYNGTREDFAKKFTDYADAYDVDSEVKKHIDSLGFDGVPDTVKELLEDIENAKDKLTALSEKFKEAVKPMDERVVAHNDNTYQLGEYWLIPCTSQVTKGQQYVFKKTGSAWMVNTFVDATASLPFDLIKRTMISYIKKYESMLRCS